MINVAFLVSHTGHILGFSMQGHSGYGEENTDIVCAAVSSAAYLTVNTVTDVLHVTPLALRVGDGDMFFRIEQKDEPACRDILAGLKLHLIQLEEQYSDYIRVESLEI
ncbi:MAG: ribosomal-processing cysteine protease Prp [Acutalibacter sp.]|nr:ribosomal-processing cysteine protease Prp [Acutalibacter sp.]